MFELKGEVETRSRPYWYAQNTLMGAMFRGRLPANWREQWRATCAEQAEQGIITDPTRIQEIEDYLDAWAKFCGLEPREGAAATEYTITIEHHKEGDTAEAPLPQKPKPLSPSWPELTPKEKEHAQSLTGLPWWYPVETSGLADPYWQDVLEKRARSSRTHLLNCYKQIAGLGQLFQRIQQGKDHDLAELTAQRDRVQAAYDRYIYSRCVINIAWATYLRTAKHIGPEVQALAEKIDGALPTRIGEFKSRYEVMMDLSLRSISDATRDMLSRAERNYTIAVWTDRVVTAIEFAFAVASVTKVAVKIFSEVAEQAGRKAATKAVVKFVATEVAVAAVSVGVSAIVIPEILAAAGLNPEEVQIGLAAYGAIGSLSTIAAAPVARRIALRKRSKSKKSTNDTNPRRKRKLTPKDKEQKLPPDEARKRAGIAFNNARASSYPYNEVPIAKVGRGKPYILDSYDPYKGEIVFRRNCQFSEIQLKTANAYFREFKSKYPPGSTIADVPSAGELAGEELKGRMIFEVPPQWKKIPRKVLEIAEESNITIRDSNGRTYHAD